MRLSVVSRPSFFPSFFKTRSLCIFALLAAALVAAVPFLMAGAGDGGWMSRVPEKDRVRQNPFARDTQAAAAGAKLFRQNCSKCHGTEGAGQDNKPALRSDRIRQATPGELEWLLNNGSMKNGMPSWSRLPEPQRWQIVTYIKDLAKRD